MTPLSQYLGSQLPRNPAQARPRAAGRGERRRRATARRLAAAAALLLALLALPAVASAGTPPPDHIVVSIPSGSPSVGQDIKVTAVAKDANNLKMSGYNGPATWTDASGKLSPAAPADFVNGVSTTIAQVGQAMSGDSIKISSDGVTGQSRSFNVTGPVDHLDVRVPSSPPVDAPFTVTVYARDAANSVVTGYSGPARLVDSAGAIDTEADFAGGVSKTAVTVSKPLHSDRITAATDALQGTSGAFNVVGAVDHLEVRVPSNVSVGSPFTVTTTARDAAGNAVPSFAPTDGTWSELFDGGGSLGAFVKGVSKTSVTLPYPEHQIHLFVAAGGLQGTSNPYNIVGPLDHIETAWTRTDGQTGCRSMMTGKLVMKAVDSLGQVIPTYNETGMTWIEGVGGLSALDPSAPAPFVKGVSSNPSVVLNYQILGVNVSLPDSDYIEVDKASGLPEAFAWVC